MTQTYQFHRKGDILTATPVELPTLTRAAISQP